LKLANFQDIFFRNSLNPPDIKKNPQLVLLTGASGMLGHGLAVTMQKMREIGLLKEMKLVLSSRNWSEEAKKFWECSHSIELITNDQITKQKMSPDLVIHAASPSNFTKIKTLEELLQVNLGMTNEILSLTPKRMVFISSGEVYGGTSFSESRITKHLSPLMNRNWYPIAKVATENRLIENQDRLNTSVAIIRLFHTFGPGVKSDDGRSFADIVWAAARGKDIVLYSAGTQKRTFLYLADAIDAILKVAFTDQADNEIYNLGSTEPYTIAEFAQMAADLVGVSVTFKVNSEYIHSNYDAIVPRINNIYELGWHPQIELKAGLNATIDWASRSNGTKTD
jgi:nucleoside-diphosphate-sugar epimerase